MHPPRKISPLSAPRLRAALRALALAAAAWAPLAASGQASAPAAPSDLLRDGSLGTLSPSQAYKDAAAPELTIIFTASSSVSQTSSGSFFQPCR